MFSSLTKVGSLVALTKTKDQALVVMAFLDRLSERKAGAASISRGGGVVSLTAGNKKSNLPLFRAICIEACLFRT